MRHALHVAAALLLVACAVAPPRPATVPATYEARRTLLQAAGQFRLEARIAAAVGQEGFSAGLTWMQRGRRSQISLQAPLGFGSAEILRDGDTLSLRSSRGDHYEGDGALEELSRRLGFAPPLDSLRYWVLGVPDPGLPGIETPDEAQRLSVLEQAGWRIQFQEYRSFGAGPLEAVLPRRLTLEREGVRLRLVADRWSVAAP